MQEKGSLVGCVLLLAFLVNVSPLWSQSPQHLWSQLADGGRAIAVDGDGNVLVTGNVLVRNQWDISLAKYNEDGALLWRKRFGDPRGFDAGLGVAVDGDGNVLVTGSFKGTVNFGGEPLTSVGEPLNGVPPADIFVAKFDAEGDHLWSKRFGDAGWDDAGLGVAVDGADNVLVTGSFQGSVTFGGEPLTSVGEPDEFRGVPPADIFVAKFNAEGDHLWSQRFGDTEFDECLSIAVDGENNVLVTGAFGLTPDFTLHIFVAKYGRDDGTLLWSHRFADAGQQVGDNWGFSIAVDGANNVLVTGQFVGTVDFGGEPLTSAGFADIFVAKFDADGDHLWSKRFGDAGRFDGVIDMGLGVAVDGANNVLVTGGFLGTVDFGGRALTSAGEQDIFVAIYDAKGEHLLSQRFGGTGFDAGRAIAVDGAGNFVVAGYFDGTVDFGGGPLTSPTSNDFVAKFTNKDSKPAFIRGDCNDDGTVDISDAISTLGVLFLGDGEITCQDACDSNDDSAADISDAIATLGVLFLGNGVIPLPGMTECGVDPTDDQIGCDSFERCP